MKGLVSLVGAGPGDPGLITVRGINLLRTAHVVVVDALVNPALLRGLKARVIYVGKRGPGAPHGPSMSLPQDVINKLLVRLGKQGKRVVRLKGGDPFVFGRGSEEIAELDKAGVPYEIVPGVTSALAVPAAAGIPVTDRRWASQVTIVTGHGQANTRGPDRVAPAVDWKKIPRDGTLLVLMGVASWKNIARKLRAAGWPASKPVAAVESGTNPDQRVIRTTLEKSPAEFETRRLVSPAIIVVGDAARLGAKSKRVVVTRPIGQSAELIARLQSLGAEVVAAPAIRIRPFGKKIPLQRRSYDWVLFLSVNAVKNFKHRLNVPAVAVGPQTKRAAESVGWHVRKTPRQFTSQGVVSALGPLRGKSILIPRVQNAPKELAAALRARGARVDEVATYETERARLSAGVKRRILKGVDVITFTSASTVDGFLGNFTRAQKKKIFQSAIAASLGPKTTAALRAFRVPRIREAKNSTIPDLIEAIQP